jgi:hypothetical protein
MHCFVDRILDVFHALDDIFFQSHTRIVPSTGELNRPALALRM